MEDSKLIQLKRTVTDLFEALDMVKYFLDRDKEQARFEDLSLYAPDIVALSAQLDSLVKDISK